MKQRKGWRMSCDVGKTTEVFENVCRAHSPNFPSLHLRRSSFSNPSVALPMSQLILQPFRCFTYVTAHSLTLLSLLRHKLFTYVTWRAAHALYFEISVLIVTILTFFYCVLYTRDGQRLRASDLL